CRIPQAGGGMCHPFPDLPGFCVFPAGAFSAFFLETARGAPPPANRLEGLRLDRRFSSNNDIEQIPTNRSSLDGMRASRPLSMLMRTRKRGIQGGAIPLFSSRFLSRLAKKPDHSPPIAPAGAMGGFSLFQMISLLALDGTPDIVLQY